MNSFKKTIYISGFMGTGKSTAGKILANILNLPFVDTDAVIEKKWGLSISAIFKKKSESFFREQETRLLQSLSRGTLQRAPTQVISLGGGIPLRFVNREILKQGIWINLKARSFVILKRVVSSAKRPLLGKKPNQDKIEQLLKSREPFYALAHAQVETDGFAPDAVVGMILKKIKEFK